MLKVLADWQIISRDSSLLLASPSRKFHLKNEIDIQQTFMGCYT